MKFFLDTEFIDNGNTIDLISIGIVAEDDSSYYALNSDCDLNKANSWVLNNVIPHLPSRTDLLWKKKSQIALEVVRFIKIRSQSTKHLSNAEYGLLVNSASMLHEFKLDKKPEIWGYYCSYDWVVLCQLFGKMIDLPKGFPYYCRDIKQKCDGMGNPRLPAKPEIQHNALEDAKWNKIAYDFLQELDR